MAKKEIDQHIRIVGWLQIAGALFFVASAVFVFLFFTGIGVFSGELKAMGILGAIGGATALFLCLLALPGLLAGYGILNRKPWARVFGIVVGIIDLAAVPIGTVIGGYTLWILFEKDAVTYFDTPVHDEPMATPAQPNGVFAD